MAGAHHRFIFQFLHLMPVLTAAENVSCRLLLPSCRGRARPAGESRSSWWPARPLDTLRASSPAASSSGWQSRAPSSPTRGIIVADEPPRLWTAKAPRKCWGCSGAHETLGKTVLMVTHDPHAAEAAKVRRRLDKGQLT